MDGGRGDCAVKTEVIMLHKPWNSVLYISHYIRKHFVCTFMLSTSSTSHYVMVRIIVLYVNIMWFLFFIDTPSVYG